ncbi:MAG: asparagine synthase (glutamine-hydrolyzing), partial [Bacteroidetes bacterium]|nr:asparagine synthase (glutamine-hydrolyzing) [Bacteroidota bacterium]
MCGFSGIVTTDQERPDQDLLRRMIQILEHRGPDDEGYFIAPGIGMAHARLSIIDLVSGKQPIHNEDNSIQVVFNGEIFNFIELRSELEKKGHIFYTQTDTEVIVHLYEEYGTDFPSFLNGQFAIALWDNRRQQLWLARDRAGICPLFYTITNNKLLFASEIKALLASHLLEAELDPQALDQIFTFWYPQPPKTIFRNVFAVLPAEIVGYTKNAELTKRKYWHWDFADPGQYYSPKSADELAEELRELLIDAVQLRLRADVPVGCYLSGGLDSSAIAAMVRFCGSSGLRTFSIGFDDPGLDESGHQLRMVQHLRTNHSTLACSPADIASQFMDTIAHTETPILRSAPVPMGMLSGLVRKHGYKVVLTGEGADEVFGGYDLFKEGKIRAFWAKQPDSLHRPMLLKRLYPYLNLPKEKAGTYLKNFFGQELEHTDLAWYAHLP